MNLLEVDSVNLSFSGRTILSDIYLPCKTGEVVGLIGRNGAGKSCLMKVTFGSMQAQNQCVRIDGTYGNPMFSRAGAINYLPQDSFLMNYLTLNKLITIFNLDQQVREISELEGVGDVKLGELSSGQKRLVEIVTVLFAPTQFSILDEPFSFLSPKLVETIIPMVRECAKSKGIILSDHQYTSVFKSCDTFYVVSNQTIHQVYSTSDLQQFGYLSSQMD